MIELKNPFILAPIKLGYSDGNGYVNDRHIVFYTARSQYLGAVAIEPLYIDKGLRETPAQLGIDDDDKIKGLQKLVSSIHQSGAKVIAHLNHPGRMANIKIPGNYFASSTDKPCENGGATPTRMNREDMEKAVDLYAAAAARAQEADFDLIELQFGHGYLLAQFLSPLVNDRNDEYGGDIENRIRFPLEVLQAVKQSTTLPIIARISGDEMLPNGIKLPDMIHFSKILEKNGAAAIHVSVGSVCSTPPWFFQHMFVPKGKTWELAKEIKQKINIPVIFVGRIHTFEDIEKVKKDYSADYIAVGRSLVADRNFIGKYLGEVKGPVRPCLACIEGCVGGVRSGQGLQCLVNPELGKETDVFEMAERSKKYAVIGGGLAGMEAAITLKKRGHSVDLYEKDQLGGQFNFAPLTPHKKSMAKLIPYFVDELKQNGVKVILKEASNSDVNSQYDAVILATGSKPSVPSIPGLETFYWADILLEENIPENKKVLIIGGGLIGVDIATALIPKDNKIIIVKRTTDFGEDMEMIAKRLSLKMMHEKGVVFSDHTYIKKVEYKTVFAERNGENILFEDVDVIVISSGMKSYNPLEKTMRSDLPVYVVGDARQIGNAQDAIRDAYETAKNL
ncbi:MAG: FAD-dependent oxidoreductase [Candidatus Omnitrophica bacterium]|nr:FAD-dependent oxidoreductase [Candidatus Omnitrophota bacterium]